MNSPLYFQILHLGHPNINIYHWSMAIDEEMETKKINYRNGISQKLKEQIRNIRIINELNNTVSNNINCCKRHV
jgi:hypothetical protein